MSKCEACEKEFASFELSTLGAERTIEKLCLRCLFVRAGNAIALVYPTEYVTILRKALGES